MTRRARHLRKRMTPAERLLWDALRDRCLDGLKFKRQCALGPFIFDFFCRDLSLVIELDGAGHNDPLQRENDAERDAACAAQGYAVLRFPNQQVLRDLPSILDAIRAHREEPHPAASTEKQV